MADNPEYDIDFREHQKNTRTGSAKTPINSRYPTTATTRAAIAVF